MDACHALESFKTKKKTQFTNATKPCKMNHEHLENFH
jgi:hypothetical protein